MSYNCKAISLGYKKINSSTVICSLITEKFGLVSYLIKGFQSKKSKTKINTLEPMGLIQIKSAQSKNRNLQRLDEIRLLVPPTNFISAKLLKLFYAEFLKKVISESTEDISLFNFLWKITFDLNSNKRIDKSDHLLFIIKLTYYLGFYPNVTNIKNSYFNLENGDFENSKSENTITKQESDIFKSILNGECDGFNKNDREVGLDILIKYFNYHNHEIKNLKSKKIIESLNE